MLVWCFDRVILVVRFLGKRVEDELQVVRLKNPKLPITKGRYTCCWDVGTNDTKASQVGEVPDIRS